MPRKVSQHTPPVNASGVDETPKVLSRTLGFRCSEAEYWAAKERAAEKQLDLTDWLRSFIEPALGGDGDRRKSERRAA